MHGRNQSVALDPAICSAADVYSTENHALSIPLFSSDGDQSSPTHPSQQRSVEVGCCSERRQSFINDYRNAAACRGTTFSNDHCRRERQHETQEYRLVPSKEINVHSSPP